MTTASVIGDYIAYGLDASKPATPNVGASNAAYYFATNTKILYVWTGSAWTNAAGTGNGANPTATAGPTAVNGTATTFLRSDGAPAIQLATNAQKGIVQVDGTSITASAGVISAATTNGANPTATAGDVAVNGVATTYMRSDGAPAIQKTSSSLFGLAKVDNTTITASSGVISASASGLGVPTAANPTATASDTAVNGVAATFLRSDGAPAVQKCSSSVFGLCKPDNSSITATGGVLTATGFAPSGVQYSAGYRSGVYYGSPAAILGSTASSVANQLYAVPFYCGVSTTFSTIAAGSVAAGGNVRMGIYNNSSVRPGTLLVDCGAVATAGTSTQITGQTITLSPGFYWLTILFDSVKSFTYNNFGSSANPELTGLFGYSSLATGTPEGPGWTAAQAYGALPGTFPAPTASASLIPAMFLKI